MCRRQATHAASLLPHRAWRLRGPMRALGCLCLYDVGCAPTEELSRWPPSSAARTALSPLSGVGSAGQLGEPRGRAAKRSAGSAAMRIAGGCTAQRSAGARRRDALAARHQRGPYQGAAIRCTLRRSRVLDARLCPRVSIRGRDIGRATRPSSPLRRASCATRNQEDRGNPARASPRGWLLAAREGAVE